MNSYPQALSTRVQNLLETPKAMRDLFTSLTRAIRLLRVKRTATAVSSLKRSKRLWESIVILTVSATIPIQNANATTYSVDQLKVYAHSRLVNYKEFQCLNKIIIKESQWSYVAHNGSHWGLGQMKSQNYRNLDPYRQIDATIKYNRTRYGSQCKALLFHLDHGWY
jgi:hypothetical protein